MGYEKQYRCKEEREAVLARGYLKKQYHIEDRESLEKVLMEKFSDGERYGYFMTFWVGAPMFNPDSLEPEHRAWFLKCMEMAEPFYPLLREKGFYAWNINEKIGLCRKTLACGLISEGEFWEIVNPWVCQAQVFYHSWLEYAVSCLCGSVYFMRQQPDQLYDFLQLNKELVRQLLEKGGVWWENAWYQPGEREWAELIPSKAQCLVTKRVLDEGRIGFMYREEPAEEFHDCGWRFFAGDEPEEYITQQDHVMICTYNEIANIDPTVLAYFYADYGREFEKGEEGWQDAAS